MSEFLTGSRAHAHVERSLLVVLFSDIAGSTDRIAAVGDTVWRETLDSFRRLVRQVIDRYGAGEVNTRGDDFFAVASSPSIAIAIARGIRTEAASIDLQYEAASTSVKSSTKTTTTQVSQSTSEHASRNSQHQAKSSSARPSATPLPDPSSTRPAAAHTLSKACPMNGRSSQSKPDAGSRPMASAQNCRSIGARQKAHSSGNRGGFAVPVTRHLSWQSQKLSYASLSTSGKGESSMQDIMIRIETDDFEAWKTQHYLHADNRAAFGISDGPAYQDIDNPHAALFHIRTDDMDRAMQWFQSDVFKEASRLAKVTGRVFYLAQPQA